jgi:hypothetical protein
MKGAASGRIEWIGNLTLHRNAGFSYAAGAGHFGDSRKGFYLLLADDEKGKMHHLHRFIVLTYSIFSLI